MEYVRINSAETGGDLSIYLQSFAGRQQKITK